MISSRQRDGDVVVASLLNVLGGSFFLALSL